MKSKVICSACGSEMVLRNSTFGKFYGCSKFPECKETHCAHQKTGEAMGVPADRETRKLRSKVHEEFDKLWKTGKMKRKEAYKWLAEKLGMYRDKCHISMFDKEMCEKCLVMFEKENI